ncbi:multicopper oxidase-domain-containing protein [Lactifluus volemus]|nr:multicopper oxidase-domain-containing protein [Lactifluus volemus]
MWSLSFVAFFAVLSTNFRAQATVIGPAFDLTIANAQIAPDGFPRQATLVNGEFPAPLIHANKGDDFALNVINNLQDTSLDLSTTIHWHGIFQRTTNYVDGAAFVTQCPIIPNNSFVYKFNAIEQAGTYLYESQFNAQSCDGLRGPLVISDPNDPHHRLYDIDKRIPLLHLGIGITTVLRAPGFREVFNSTLINGKGRFVGGPSVPLAVVNVTRGLRYRLRIVSISCDPAFDFSIDGHQFTIIEVDGNNVQPWSSILLRSLLVNVIRLFSLRLTLSQLNANQPIGNYWIRALPNLNNGDQGFTDFTNLAILHYRGAPLSPPNNDPTNIPLSVQPLLETDLHPLSPIEDPVPGLPFPGGADININLDIRPGPNHKYLVNGVAFNPPPVPVLLQILMARKQITIPGRNSIFGPLPIHLHGHSFHVVRSAGSRSTTSSILLSVTCEHRNIAWQFVRGLAVVLAEDVPEVPTKDITDSTSHLSVYPEAYEYVIVLFSAMEWPLPAYNNFASP